MTRFYLEGNAVLSELEAMNAESEFEKIGLHFSDECGYVRGEVEDENVSNYLEILSIVYRHIESGTLIGEVILSTGKKKKLSVSKANVYEGDDNITRLM
ncbi:hypothetical protein ACUSRQ_005135 [Vibrio harveyi]|nr:hypothetical protein [Vibrio harveyi]